MPAVPTPLRLSLLDCLPNPANKVQGGGGPESDGHFAELEAKQGFQQSLTDGNPEPAI